MIQPERRRRRPTLFRLLLIAFVMVIVFGVGGMAVFFAISVVGPWQHDTLSGLDGYRLAAEVQAAQTLNSYYTRQRSWAGLAGDPSVTAALGQFDSMGRAYTLISGGEVITTTRLDLSVGTVVPGEMMPNMNVMPIGKNAGTLVITLNTPPYAAPPTTSLPVNRSDWFRGMLSAGLALAAVLIGLAAFFARRISRPLNTLTQAAGRMATGDLAVRVPGSAVREVNALALAFNQMGESLAAADAQRRQMTADVAHELRTPLSIIRARLEGLQDGVYQATPDQVALLLDETALLERLIEDLRLLALADAGQLPLYPVPLDPLYLLQDAADSFAGQAAAADVALRVEAPAVLPEITADPQRLAQVLGNLVSNALHHTPPGGGIVLRAWADTTPDGPMLGLAVADSGSGIAPADLPHIFDRFWRADRARVRAGAGAGLGLAIARRIVEAHGGRIQAWSAPGQGTQVSFWVPVRPVLAPAAPIPLPRAAPPPTDKITHRLDEAV
jgi:two-component system OmpR family sensor kinase/two-component system sensor histidine kinase BaeS